MISESGLNALDVGHVRYYLSQHQFSAQKANDVREIWAGPNDTKLFLPLRKDEDFASLMGEVLDRIAASERRDVADVMIDLSWPGFDKLTARTHANSSSHAVPIQEAIDSSDALRDLVVAAARASESPQPTYRGGWSSLVAGFFDQVRMIPSMPGSFTLRALLPINTEPPDRLLVPSVDDSNVRAVTKTLLVAVRAAKNAALERTRGASSSVFEDAVSRGVSADLLDALVRLGGIEHDAGDLELSVSWTYSAPEPPSPPVLIEAGLLPSLAEGVAILRHTTEEELGILTGSVIRLHRDQLLGSGEVTVRGYLDAGAGSSVRNLTFELDEQSYQTAIAAHGNGSTVRAACTVRFAYPRLVVVRVSRFEIVEQP